MGNYWAALNTDKWTIGDVRFHWGSAYAIFRSLGCYRAMRRDHAGETLIARDLGELVNLIRNDMTAAPRKVTTKPAPQPGHGLLVALDALGRQDDERLPASRGVPLPPAHRQI